jgi:hypothetical protein
LWAEVLCEPKSDLRLVKQLGEPFRPNPDHWFLSAGHVSWEAICKRLQQPWLVDDESLVELPHFGRQSFLDWV